MTATLKDAATGAHEDQDLVDGTASGPDPEKGKLFEVPRIAVTVDESDPGTIKIAFSGSIELDRAKADDVSFYNRLVAGKNVALRVEAFVAGPKNTHRRDSDGNVDAIVQTKSLVVHSIATPPRRRRKPCPTRVRLATRARTTNETARPDHPNPGGGQHQEGVRER